LRDFGVSPDCWTVNYSVPLEHVPGAQFDYNAIGDWEVNIKDNTVRVVHRYRGTVDAGPDEETLKYFLTASDEEQPGIPAEPGRRK
jgi:hypothetical protein